MANRDDIKNKLRERAATKEVAEKAAKNTDKEAIKNKLRERATAKMSSGESAFSGNNGVASADKEAIKAKLAERTAERRRRNLYGTLYNASLAKDQQSGELSQRTHSLAMRAFEPSVLPFDVNYQTAKSQNEAARTLEKRITEETAKRTEESAKLLSYDTAAAKTNLDNMRALLDSDIDRERYVSLMSDIASLKQETSGVKTDKSNTNNPIGKYGYRPNASASTQLSKAVRERDALLAKYGVSGVDADNNFFIHLAPVVDTNTHTYKLDESGSALRKHYNEKYEEYRWAVNVQAPVKAKADPNFDKVANSGVSLAEGIDVEFMTDEEKKVMYYYYGLGDVETAQVYYDTVSDTFKLSEAQKKAASYNNKWYEFVPILGAGVERGLTNLTQGTLNMITGSEDGIEYSASVLAAEIARLDDTGARKVINDLAFNTGNMLPSIGASIFTTVATGNPVLGKTVGSAVVGVGAASSAYDEMIQLGYSVEQARTYGFFVGTSEAVLDRALSGIEFIGGNGVSKAGAALNRAVPQVSAAVNRALAAISINHPYLAKVLTKGGTATLKIAGNAASEATEEALQSVLEPIFKALATGEDFEGVNLDEVIYSALLGALSGGMFKAIEYTPAAVRGTGDAVKSVTNKAYDYVKSKFGTKEDVELYVTEQIKTAKAADSETAASSGEAKAPITTEARPGEMLEVGGGLLEFGPNGEIKIGPSGVIETASESAPTAEATESASDGVNFDDVLSAVSSTLKPEITSNTEFMSALTERFGENVTERLSEAVVEQYSKDGTVADFEGLFVDGGEEIYKALSGGAKTNIRYSVDENFSENYDSWVKRGRPDREVMSVGTTSEALKSIGVKNQKITWDTSKINKSLNKHAYLNDELMKSIPDLLETPVIVMQSKQSDSRITLFGEVYDGDGLPVMAVLELLPLNRAGTIVLDEIKIVSTHSRKTNNPSDISQTQNLINASDILYVDPNKKRTDNWLTLNRLQLPLSITDYGPIKSITYPEGNVNTYSMQNTKDYSQEEITDEQSGNSLLSGNSRREYNESSREQARRVSVFEQKIKGKPRTERQAFAKELAAKNLTEEKVDAIYSNGKRVAHKYTLVKPENYNDDMRSIAAEAEAKGKKVGFFIGPALRQFDGQRDFLIDGIKVSDTEMLLRYDGYHSPQSLLKHEEVHTDWYTPEMQEAKDVILNDLSEDEKNALLSEGRYKAYKDLYEGDEDAVWQEFVADVFAGMNDYTANHIDAVTDYWYGENAIDRYTPAEYNNIMDAGGADARVPNNVRLPNAGSAGVRYMFAGEKSNNADVDSLERAKEMSVRGNGEETVFAETGWFKGGDGKWRFEIDDSASKFFLEKLKDGSELTLSDIWHNDAVYTAYPFLKNVKIKVVSFGDDSKARGEYDALNNCISLSDEVLDADVMRFYADEYMGVLLHEVQHAVQFYEGFEPGGNPREMLDYLRQEVQYWLGDNDERFKRIVTSGTFRDIDDYVDSYIIKLSHTQSVEEAAFKAYRHLHGEKEADAVKKRFKLTPEERSKKYPDYGKGAIVRKNDNERTNQAIGISKATERTPGSGFAENILADTGRGVGEGEQRGSREGYGRVRRDTQFSSEEASFATTESDTAELASENNKRDPRYAISPDISDAEFWQSWLNKVKEFGAIPKGENPARDIDVPKKISEKKVVSRFARTLLEAGVTPDENVSDFEKAVLAGEMTHEVITNKKAENKAVGKIKNIGFKEALRDWEGKARDGRIGKEDFVFGMVLYNQCITNKDVHNAMKIAADLAAEATRAGQTVQACRMLKLMTPDGQLYYLEKSIQKMNEEFRDKLGDKYSDIELDEKLMSDFLTEQDEAKRDIAYDKLCQHIADQIPATLRDKWNSWRYLAMLGNPRTHIRNVVGNAMFVPAVRTKNYVGAVIESIAHVKPGERTKSFRKTKGAIAFAEKDFAVMAKTLQGENAKYAVTSDIEGKRTIFKTRWLEALRRKNFDFLEKEDMWFLKMHYVDALARLITVRKIDVNSVTPQTLDTLRAFAVREAQAATYRDANALADGLSKLQGKIEHSDNRIVRATGILVEGVMPFKKTPMNIAKQGVNYSPVGILKGIYKSLKRLKGGEVTAAEVIDDLSKGLTGTLVMALGCLLASLGFIVGAEDKSKKEKEFDKMVGEQSYALKVNDAFTYTLDWMAPSNLPLFIGVKLYDLTKDDFSVADVINAVSTISEPLLELSVFSGVNGVIESAQYSDSAAILAIGSDMITSYLTQALPTIGGQLSRIIDNNKREYYYADKNSDMPPTIQRLIGQASSKIPFASYLFESAIDEWGREETYGGIVERVLENTVSPGYYAADSYTEVDKQLRELYERTGETDVLPTTQQKYYTEGGIRYHMSAKDFTEVKKLRGQKSFELVSELLAGETEVELVNEQTGKHETKTYDQMSDSEKVKAIRKCYTKAGEYAKEQMLEKVKSRSK